MKRNDAVAHDDQPREVEFLALPGIGDVRRMMEQNVPPEKRESLLRRYRAKMETIRRAQGKAAVVALEACRPDDFRKSNDERRFAIERANHEHEQRCLKVFSDYCTRGL